NGVLMDAEQPRNVLHRIIPVNLHKPRIGMSRAHRLMPDRLPTSSAEAARCALPPIGPARSVHQGRRATPCRPVRARTRSRRWRSIGTTEVGDLDTLTLTLTGGRIRPRHSVLGAPLIWG